MSRSPPQHVACLQVPLLQQTDSALRYFRAQQLNMDNMSSTASPCTCVCTCADRAVSVPRAARTSSNQSRLAQGCACAGHIAVSDTVCTTCGHHQPVITTATVDMSSTGDRDAAVCPGVSIGATADPLAVFHPTLTIEVRNYVFYMR